MVRREFLFLCTQSFSMHEIISGAWREENGCTYFCGLAGWSRVCIIHIMHTYPCCISTSYLTYRNALTSSRRPELYVERASTVAKTIFSSISASISSSLHSKLNGVFALHSNTTFSPRLLESPFPIVHRNTYTFEDVHMLYVKGYWSVDWQ